MLMGIFCFLLMCLAVSIFGNLNPIGWILAIIEWIVNLPVFWGVVVCLSPFILSYVLCWIIKVYRKK